MIGCVGTSLVDRAATSGPMRVGIIDVGADTLRLLVAAASSDEIATVHRERVRLGLGDHVEATGRLRRAAIEAASRAARKRAATARRLGCSRVEIVVTSPGRQAANAGELVAALAQIRGATTRVLTAEQEGACAYYGALAAISGLPDTVAVCDVGGGSTQIVVGSRDGGPAWARSRGHVRSTSGRYA
jgi:exopolyphosphatase/guanosine-5'-triphosphate,3'-diphosphate pyrophosphatase